MHKDETAVAYRAYLLRCWRVGSQRPGMAGTWRFSLQDVWSGQKRGFADPAGLADFLREVLDLQGRDCGSIHGPAGS